ncbi:Concanavalin A-like lectin/glucanases superfamily [Pseudocohnilembus persalinus]|uniref:Concanavalin A-like lectin/glucanases superfamily n=1 Tax=Pseudocohnilembus persalinus TaxID=266149 RepID=A0A0V0QS30_PSEPJ|nr:Concanavalin A-like lectin/glucanases superfamily [Pseudocohnilembus persalinus]|eukprot:KRX04794.1 Concanavalin A-like lectin/glucanases superfamily [Pseudocohnilembus persalinus]
MASGQYLLKLLEKKMDQEYAKNTIIEQRNCPFFKVGSNQLTVYYTGRNLAYVDYTSVQSNQPARKEDFVYYYECSIDQKGQNQNDLCIGFADKDFPPNKMPGFTSKYGSSYGYMSSGTLYTGKHPVLANLPKFEKKDIIGCGINYFTKEIFFTVNGKLIAGIRCEEEEIREFYATVGLHGIQTQITFNFGKKEFLFNIKDYIEQEKKKGVSSVMEQELPIYQIHEIVHSYLYFQGYFDTLKEFESACQLNRDNVFLMKNDNPNRQINQNQFIEKINSNIQKICQNQQKQLDQNVNNGKNFDMELEMNENKNSNFDQANSNQQNNIVNNQQKSNIIFNYNNFFIINYLQQESIDIEEEESKQKNEEYQDIKIEENGQNGHNQQNIKSNQKDFQKDKLNNSELNKNDQNIDNNVKIGESKSQLKIEDFNNYQMTTIEETDLTRQQQQIKQEPINTNNKIDSDTNNKETQQLIKNQQDCNQKNGSYTQKKDQNLNQKQQNEQDCNQQSNENFQQNKQNQQNNQHNGNSNNNTAKKEKNNNDKNKTTQINSNNHNMYFINEHNSNNKMPQNKQNNRYSNRKMTDDFSLVKERMRSDSFNQEFDMSHSFFKKDSIDFNFENSFNKEFSNNFSNIDQQAINQMILGSQSNIFMGIDIQNKQDLDEVQKNLIKSNKDKMEKYRGRYMGYSERSVLELLIKQLILIQERFRDDNTGFGNVFQFSA